MEVLAPTKPVSKAPIITIIGLPGTGKTSLGGMFPNAVFIQGEESGTVFDTWAEDAKPVMFPIIAGAKASNMKDPKNTKLFQMASSPFESVMNQLRWLNTQQHEYQTLVIDSSTALHRLFETEICLKEGADSVGNTCGGFHKGYDALSDWHAKIMNALNALRTNRGMTIIILAHAGVHRLKNRPDVDDYTVWSMEMNAKSVPVYVNFSDAVLYLVKEEFVKDKEVDRKGVVTKWGKIMQTGTRKLITTGDGQVGYVHAKNRYNMPVSIPLLQGSNPIMQYIPFYKKTTN